MAARAQRMGTDTGTETRLRWWALALPSVAFALLLLLVVHGTDAEAAAQRQPIAELIAHVGRGLLP